MGLLLSNRIGLHRLVCTSTQATQATSRFTPDRHDNTAFKLANEQQAHWLYSLFTFVKKAVFLTGITSYEAKRELIQIASKTPGVPIRIGGSADRPEIDPELIRHLLNPDMPSFAVCQRGDCSLAALINSLFMLRGRDYALAAKYIIEPMAYRMANLRELSDFADAGGIGVQMRKLSPDANREPGIGGGWQFMSTSGSGIFICRVSQLTELDHCVAIHGKEGVLFDGVQGHALTLCQESLSIGMDPACKYACRVLQMREVVLEPVTTSSKKKMRKGITQ